MLELKVVAEGVEDAATQEMLEGMGCDQIQGWLYYKAMTAQDVEAHLVADEGVAHERDEDFLRSWRCKEPTRSSRGAGTAGGCWRSGISLRGWVSS